MPQTMMAMVNCRTTLSLQVNEVSMCSLVARSVAAVLNCLLDSQSRSIQSTPLNCGMSAAGFDPYQIDLFRAGLLCPWSPDGNRLNPIQECSDAF